METKQRPNLGTILPIVGVVALLIAGGLWAVSPPVPEDKQPLTFDQQQNEGSARQNPQDFACATEAQMEFFAEQSPWMVNSENTSIKLKIVLDEVMIEYNALTCEYSVSSQLIRHVNANGESVQEMDKITFLVDGQRTLIPSDRACYGSTPPTIEESRVIFTCDSVR